MKDQGKVAHFFERKLFNNKRMSNCLFSTYNRKLNYLFYKGVKL